MNAEIIKFEEIKSKIRKEKQRKFIKRYCFLTLFLSIIFISVIFIDTEETVPLLNAQTPEIFINESGESVTSVTSNQNGHFIFLGKINDVDVKFIYDTGASFISIPQSIANYLDLIKGNEVTTNTANGKSVSYETHLMNVKVGVIEIDSVRALISPNLKNDEILLGMSFLRNLEIKYGNDRLEFIKR